MHARTYCQSDWPPFGENNGGDADENKKEFVFRRESRLFTCIELKPSTTYVLVSIAKAPKQQNASDNPNDLAQMLKRVSLSSSQSRRDLCESRGIFHSACMSAFNRRKSNVIIVQCSVKNLVKIQSPVKIAP